PIAVRGQHDRPELLPLARTVWCRELGLKTLASLANRAQLERGDKGDVVTGGYGIEQVLEQRLARAVTHGVTPSRAVSRVGEIGGELKRHAARIRQPGDELRAHGGQRARDRRVDGAL